VIADSIRTIVGEVSPSLHLVHQDLLVEIIKEVDQDPMIVKVEEDFQIREQDSCTFRHLQIPLKLLGSSQKKVEVTTTMRSLILYLTLTFMAGLSLTTEMPTGRFIIINLSSQNFMLVLKLIKEMDQLEEQQEVKC
jgi:hypothetical protein